MINQVNNNFINQVLLYIKVYLGFIVVSAGRILEFLNTVMIALS